MLGKFSAISQMWLSNTVLDHPQSETWRWPIEGPSNSVVWAGTMVFSLSLLTMLDLSPVLLPQGSRQAAIAPSLRTTFENRKQGSG